MNIHTSRRELTRKLALATAIVSALGIMVEILARHQETHGWLVVFDLDKEWNVPSAFSAFLLFAAGALLAMIASECRRLGVPGRVQWMVLAIIFCFLGFDELFSIHNSAKHLVPLWFKHITLFNLRWDLRWIVIGIPFTLIVVILFIPFVLRLPRRTMCGIIISGVVYVGSALGLEVWGGWWIAKHTKNNWTYAGEVVLEETGEMVGALLFLSVLLAYVERELNGRARLGFLLLELNRESRDQPTRDFSTR